MKTPTRLRIGLLLVLAALGVILFWNKMSIPTMAEVAPAMEDAPAKAPDAPAATPPDAPHAAEPEKPEDHDANSPHPAEDTPAQASAHEETPAPPAESAVATDKTDDAEPAPVAEVEAPEGATGDTVAAPGTPGSANGNGKKNGKARLPRQAAKRTAPKGPSYDSFRIVVERNIFSSKRVPRAVAADQAAAAAKPQTQVLRLMGAYLTPERTLALFEGTADVPGGGFKQGDTIAGYRVEDIRVDAAVLANDKGKIEISVGSGLTKKDDGTWALVDKPVVERTDAAPASGDPAASSGAKADDPVEKLRARRRKELGQ